MKNESMPRKATTLVRLSLMLKKTEVSRPRRVITNLPGKNKHSTQTTAPRFFCSGANSETVSRTNIEYSLLNFRLLKFTENCGVSGDNCLIFFPSPNLEENSDVVELVMLCCMDVCEQFCWNVMC